MVDTWPNSGLLTVMTAMIAPLPTLLFWAMVAVMVERQSVHARDEAWHARRRDLQVVVNLSIYVRDMLEECHVKFMYGVTCGIHCRELLNCPHEPEQIHALIITLLT